MPPFIPRKRPSPPAEEATPPAKKRATPASKKSAASTKKTVEKNKPSLFDALDASKTGATAEETKALLANLNGDDSDSDLSDEDSDDFEDVPIEPPSKRRRVGMEGEKGSGDDSDDESDEMDFEDVSLSNLNGDDDDDSMIQDVNITLKDDGTMAAEAAEAATARHRNLKKGPSKRERQVRIRSHMMHVQALVFHNAVRNSWLNDKQVQKVLVDGLSEGVKKEVDRWKIDMGYMKPPEQPKKSSRGKRKSGKPKDKRDGRDWGIDADRLEVGAVNLSRGDPLLRLLKVLAAYWKKRFTTTAPGIRKLGYMPLRRLADELKHWDKNKTDQDQLGERIESIEQFRKLAKECEGSRDVGAQLFTALIRGLGIEARMVANLQPVGFGWSKAEEAAPRKLRPFTSADDKPKTAASAISISDNESDSVQEIADPKTKKKKVISTPTKALTPQKPIRTPTKGIKNTVDQSDSNSTDLSSVPSDDDSIIDITPSVAPASKKRPTKKYDRDLFYPHYWTEVLSPVSNTYIPVDSIVLSTVASNGELLATFEPRGKAADTAKQVMCYTLAYNHDSTLKDVTIRYLKKHQMPGRTKGYRMMPERIPIHNKRGKVLRYEDQDWFATVIYPWLRPAKKQTEAEIKEDATDLKPFKPAGAGEGNQKIGEESLQWYKQSAEFVLERHLRREEALLPGSEPVREFTSGKGDKAKTEPVYSRADVVPCKTVESWHKEGRAIKIGEQPLKMVPVRAVTLIRKREMEEVQRETGEKLKQGLYSIEQTDWIIPDPIGEDRVIPKNAFGNMDCYVPSMVPRGAVHVKLKGCAKLCRKLNIDHAEACVGFEFGKQRAVPVLFGVVVAEENVAMVRDAWRTEQEIQKRKEDVKREATMLHLWRKFVMGMRIVERMKAEYKDNGNGEEVNPFVNRERQRQERQPKREEFELGEPEEKSFHDPEEGGGGFFLPGEEEASVAVRDLINGKAEENDPYAGGGGFILDDEDEEADVPPAKSNGAIQPMSLQSAHRGLSRLVDAEAENEDDEADSDDEPEAIPAPKAQKRQPSKAAGKTTKSTPRKAAKQAPSKTTAKKKTKAMVTPSETEGGSASDLTELSSASVSDTEETEQERVRGTRARRGGPRVVITPKMSRLGSVKSRFFKGNKMTGALDDDENGDEDGDVEMRDEVDEDDDEEDDEEVVKPRRTTARTRKSLA